MIKKREFGFILIAILIMAFVISLTYPDMNINAIDFLYGLVYAILILFVSVIAKHITASIIHIEIEHSTWKLTRFWISKKRHLKHALPMGIIFPLLLSILSAGYIKCFAFLQFDSVAKLSKIIKEKGTRRYVEIMEWDLALIAFYGIVAVLVLSLVANFLTISSLAKFAVYYCMWNLIPFGQLDGLKILMGSPGLGGNSKFFIPLYIISWILTILVWVIILF